MALHVGRSETHVLKSFTLLLRIVCTGTTHHVCQILTYSVGSSKCNRIVYYASTQPADITNAIYILGAWLTLHTGATPVQAMTPFLGVSSSRSPPYRDASWNESTFDLGLRDCWGGLMRAKATGLLNIETFDKAEYW